MNENHSIVDQYSRCHSVSIGSFFRTAFKNSKREDQWCEKLSANTSVAHTAGNSWIDLSVAASSAQNASAVRQTRNYWGTQMAKSNLFYISGVLNAENGASQQTGITARLGVFDDDNGVFFELADNTLYVVKRNNASGSVVDDKVEFGEWNINNLESIGTLDVNARNIFFLQFDALNAGDISVGIVFEEHNIKCHTFRHANVGSSASEAQMPYMNSNQLPIRHQMIKTGTGAESGSSRLLSCAYLVEDEVDHPTTIFSFSRTYPASELLVDEGYEPLISYRVKSSTPRASINPRKFTLLNTRGSAPINYAILLFRSPLALGSGPLGGSPAWTALSASPASNTLYSENSVVEYDYSASTVDVSAATYPYKVLNSGFFTSFMALDAVNLKRFCTGADVDGNTDWLVIVAQRSATGGNVRLHGGMQWYEMGV